jgi:hypothetical protein
MAGRSAPKPATLAAALLGRIGELSLSPGTVVGGEAFTVHPIELDRQPLRLQLAEDLGSISVPVEPVGYTQHGARKTLTFSVPQPVFEGFVALEEACRQELAGLGPDVQALWHSSVCPARGLDQATLRAKINVSGPRGACYYNGANSPVGQPGAWSGLPVNAVLHARGCYVRRLASGAPSAYGLMLEVSHVSYGEVSCPF